MSKRPAMVKMNLPELAQVIVEGNARGKESAQFLLHEKMRIARDTPAVLDEVDHMGRTAAQVLVQSREHQAIETFFRLLTQGAAVPAGTDAMVEDCAQREMELYAMMEAAHALEQRGRRLLAEDTGNWLHVIAQRPGSLAKIVAAITDSSRTFMHRWQAPVMQWMTQGRASDGATPLHVALRGVPLDAPGSVSELSRNFLLLCPVVRWFVQQGGALTLADQAGDTTAQMIQARLHQINDIEVRLGIETLAELQRAALAAHAGPTAQTTSRMRL